ncbi:hypothetical protein NGI13_22145 [Enterobacter asburiae]|uniref:hypothetical protein n=1 Tax=Enterobacter TaxID=547 RepID=UPI0004DB4625|nr:MULTISPECIES: hypothetical protein [Enterobacter]KFA84211.1 hypothetical protein N037_22345 [Enterobacter sp. EGD-HP1]MEB8258257.1 hypothetical protein [Enterobacter asburiae]
MSELEIRSPLLHLALLETLKSDEIQDEIDLFLPFIAVTASEVGKQVINETDIQERLLQSFGFKPPMSAVKVLMTRARKRGLLIKENHAFIPCHEKINDWKNGFEHKQEDVRISLNSLKVEFVNFTQEKFRKKITEDEAEKLILRFIEINVSSVISERAYRKSELNDTIKNTDHLIASFISNIHRSQPVLLEHFSRCVKGMLLANYLFYADKATTKKSYAGITIYLDSPIVLGLLGYSGKQSKETYHDFLNLLQSLHIRVCIFDRTFDEIEGLLQAWKSDLSRKYYGRFNTKTLEWLRGEGYDTERLDTEIKLLDSSIARFGINVIQGFRAKKQFQCDEEALQSAISQRFSPNKNYEHDTICISRIHNLREGQIINNLNQSFSVFVTHNIPLQKLAYEFFKEEIGRNAIPLVVSEQWMTAMFWLKRPDIYGNLPQEQLLSTAYSLLYTDDKFWNAFLVRFEGLQKRGGISEDDFLRIRWDSDLLRVVHRVSVDVGEDFSEEDIFDVVATINKKHTEKHDAEMEVLRTEHQEMLRLIKHEAEEQVRLAAEGKADAQIQLGKLEQRVKKISNVISKVVAWGITMLFVMALTFTGLKGIPEEIQPDFLKSEFLQGSVLYVAGVLTLVLGLLGSAFGKDLSFFHKKISTTLERCFLNWIYGKR